MVADPGRAAGDEQGHGAEAAMPDEIDGVDVQAACEALSMLMCPWRLRIGICEAGCQTEPACETCEPPGGWALVLREAVAL